MHQGFNVPSLVDAEYFYVLVSRHLWAARVRFVLAAIDYYYYYYKERIMRGGCKHTAGDYAAVQGRNVPALVAIFIALVFE
jgi:hypothetical protein